MYYDAPSKIHGMGIFSTEPIRKGAIIKFDEHWRTHQGFNSSCVPNVSPSDEIGDYQIRRALSDIPAGEELVVNYRLFPGECKCGHCKEAESKMQSNRVCHCHHYSHRRK